jgi:hypothetical protein
MSGLWGYQTALDLFLKENGITTLLFSGVNADQVNTQINKKKNCTQHSNFLLPTSASWVLL